MTPVSVISVGPSGTDYPWASHEIVTLNNILAAIYRDLKTGWRLRVTFDSGQVCTYKERV